MHLFDAITRDCFNVAIQLRVLTADPHVDAEQLHLQVREHIDRMCVRALVSGVTDYDVNAMTFAVACLLDTVATRGKGPISNFWRNHLLLEQYFGDAQTLDGFFERLELLQQSNRRDLLRIYALCMALGVRGHYRTVEVDRMLQAMRPYIEPSSVSPVSSGSTSRLIVGASQRWQALWIPVGAVMISAALYLILNSSMHTETASFVSWVDALARAN